MTQLEKLRKKQDKARDLLVETFSPNQLTLFHDFITKYKKYMLK